ncbi:MAG TPA: DUF4198 domain-containing protein [Terricaulis sp.]|nr:DUF4198 domain-containing protein [Terricaulis sp.]
MKRTLLAAMLFAAAAGPAAAYTAFILPETFNPNDGQVAAEAAYANTFFDPAVGLPADIKLIYPDGFETGFSRVAVSGGTTELSGDLPQWGTYRVTTGELQGAIATLVAQDGAWRPLAQGEVAPEGAEITTIQTITLADAYMSRGAPTRGVVDTAIGALALVPVTHPNEVLVSQGLQVELRFNGQPFPNMPIVLYEAGDPDTDQSSFFVTDAQGRATIALPAAGNYVIAARHRADAPENAGVDVRSYVTTLTFSAITAIPAYPAPPAAEPQRQRRRGLDR